MLTSEGRTPQARDVAGLPPLVVVIEDEAIVLAGYQMLFESWGYRVIAAQSADEAVALIAS
jgi:CheY-like chemotaxis protein